jgi:uncharacterized membrane protein
MALDVTVRLEIDRARDEVAAYATDPNNDPIWIGGVSEVEMLSDPPLRQGSRVRRVAGFLGKRFEYVLEVAELVPNAKILMRSVKSPFPMVVTYEFSDSASGGTIAQLRTEGDPGVIYRVAGPVMSSAVKRALNGDLKRLKKIAEALPQREPAS